MKYKLLANQYKVSCVGIGGHYRRMEEGFFEERYAKVEPEEVKIRTGMMEKAVAAGITYFDTTWRNEVEMLGKSIQGLGIRDNIFINGMVLGAFRGSTATGMDVCDYFNKWLDKRLPLIPGQRFDSFMINAIEEDYDEGKCEKLVRLLEKRRENGDFKIFGFSCHSQPVARRIADTFPEFQTIMIPYNFKNRKLEQAFEGYRGNASFIAMKPLVWAEYGIPFCTLNDLPNAGEVLGMPPRENIAAAALKYLASNDRVTSVVCGINGEKELDQLIEAGSVDYDARDEQALECYNKAQAADKGIPFFISALSANPANIRLRYFAVVHLARSLQVSIPDIPLNEDSSSRLLSNLAGKLLLETRKQGYGRYINK